LIKEEISTLFVQKSLSSQTLYVARIASLGFWLKNGKQWTLSNHPEQVV